jgi:hypothetical protein
LEDNKSNDSDNGSIYSTNISLEDYESNNLDNGSICTEDYNIFWEDEFNNSDDDSIYSADISLENYDLNEDVINDTNRSIDYGKNLIVYIYMLYNFYKLNIFLIYYF